MWSFEAKAYSALIAPEGAVLRPAGAPTDSEPAWVAAGIADAGWRSGLAAFHEALAAVPERPAVAVALSNRYARYLTVPWSDALVVPEEEHVFLGEQFAAVFGDAASAWAFAAEDAPRGAARVACALDKELIAAISAAVRARRGRIVSLAPWLIGAINRCRSELGRNGWFVAAEPGCMAIAELQEGAVARVSTSAYPADEVPDVCRAVRRAALRSGRDGDLPIWLADPGALGAATSIDGVRRLVMGADATPHFWGLPLVAALA